MNLSNDHSEAAWECILPHIRATSRRRRKHRIVAAIASCALLGAWLVFQPARPPAAPPVARADPAPTAHETIAVMRIGDDGSARLEEVSCDELGALELAFCLTPVITHDWEIW